MISRAHRRIKKPVEVRRAIATDAAAICAVVRASILELCTADHHGDSAILARWLANKTPEHVARWIANPANLDFVATNDGIILGAGCVNISGEIILNYVSPAARFCGVSSILLATMEQAARQANNTHCALESTSTAHRFYLERGYRDVGVPGTKHGLVTYPMTKTLTECFGTTFMVSETR